MSEPDPHRFEEFNVDHRAVEVESLVRRIVSERERRITAEFPAWRQVQLIAAGVVLMFDKTLTSDELRVVETDATALKSFVQCVTRNRLAADLLIKSVRKPGADLGKINPTAKGWWQYEQRT